MRSLTQHKFKTWLYLALLLTVASVLLFYSGYATATAMDIGSVANQVTKSMSGLAKLITAGSYVAGFGFAVGAILKFKAHRDNPTQIPVGTPIALIFIAAALIFLPTLFGVSGETLFGSGAETGSVTGTTSFSY